MMSLTELAVLIAAKNAPSRAEIAKSAVALVQDERFDERVALKVIDQMLKSRFIYQEDNVHKVSEAGQRTLLIDVAILDSIRSAIRTRLFI